MKSGIIALVPARAGSKRLAQKNRMPLGGVPLIGWTLRTAHKSGCFERVIVSTEDTEIAEIARAYGGEVPWLRPPELAGDEVRAAQVSVHVLGRLLDEGDDIEAMMLLQPTSPFRSAQTIRAAVELYRRHAGDSVVSVAPVAEHPYWCKRIDEQGVIHSFVPDVIPPRSQSLTPAYRVNGAVYLASTRTLLDTGGFYGVCTRALVMSDPIESLDIDTQYDWQIADIFAGRLLAAAEGDRV